MIRIAPSILAADFLKLNEDIQSVEESSSIDLLHLDVMDGHFVPNITFGPDLVRGIKKQTECELDVHLMVEDPNKWIEAFANAGASYLSVHAEVTPHLHRTLQHIHSFGIKAGVALNPSTSIEAIRYVLRDVDFILLMTVNPGFGGQAFIPQILDKIRDLKHLMEEIGHFVPIEVDGGINKETIKKASEAGASWFVAGSAIFNEPDRKQAVKELLDACGDL
jgi:ribulose-phosphate 3-epimerase